MANTDKTEAAKPAAKTAAKAAPKSKATRTPSKARTPAKKTTATRTATKKAASAKAAATPKPAAKKPAAASAPAKKAAAKKTPKTETKPAAKKPAAKADASASKATAKKADKTVAKSKQTPKSAAPKGSAKKAGVTSKIKAIAEARKAKTETEEPSEEDKPKIAPAPLRPALKVARRAEANRDKNQTFKVRTKIVYPAHGVGYITEIERQEIAGHKIELFVIDFEHEKMKLRVPVQKAAASGMRNLAKPERIDEMLELIEGKARVKRTMWSRRAQEYEAKINSGDLQAVCEVVRDLFRADDQPEQSYSERQLFEQARERFGRELAAVRRKSLESAIKEIHVHLDRKEKAPAA